MFVRSVGIIFLVAFTSLTAHDAALAQQSQASYEVVHGWPQLPEGFLLGEVSGVAVDSHDHIFVFHRGQHPVMGFEGCTGKVIAAWGDGVFGMSHGLRVDNHDNLWLTDIGHHQVHKFSHEGELLMSVGAKDVPGCDRNHFNRPTDVTITPSGEFYVSGGYGNSRLAKFSAEGEFVFDWGKKGNGSGEFDIPHNVTVDSQGRVYVADRGNARIQVFDSNGKYITEFKGAKLGRPWGIVVAPDGFLYVTDGGDIRPEPPDRAAVRRVCPCCCPRCRRTRYFRTGWDKPSRIARRGCSRK